MDGRLTGSAGEQRATDYIARQFKELGLQAAGDNGTFFQKFDFIPDARDKKIQHGRNVLAQLILNPDSRQMILIGAHADHLGHGELGGSRARGSEQGALHPGADDNASGVAVMLEVAAQLSSLKKQGVLHGQQNILFAAWSAEEYGVLGSSYFITHFNAKNARMKAAVNLDMVGHLGRKLIIQGVGSSTAWPQIFKHASLNVIPLTVQSDPYLPTDALSFYVHKIPVINLFTGAHDEYHTPRDTAATLNYIGMTRISNFLIHLIDLLEKPAIRLGYREVPKSHDTMSSKLLVYLGTIPDYAHSDVAGLKLSGVAKNSPAEQGGLKQGDIIVRLAGNEIHDIYEYTSVLNRLKPGKSVRVTVFRKANKVDLTVIPQPRN